MRYNVELLLISDFVFTASQFPVLPLALSLLSGPVLIPVHIKDRYRSHPPSVVATALAQFWSSVMAPLANLVLRYHWVAARWHVLTCS